MWGVVVGFSPNSSETTEIYPLAWTNAVGAARSISPGAISTVLKSVFDNKREAEMWVYIGFKLETLFRPLYVFYIISYL